MKLNKAILSIFLLSNIIINAESLTAISGNQSDQKNDTNFQTSKEEVENKLSNYYQDDTKTLNATTTTESTDWTMIGLPKNCGPWRKTVSNEIRDCEIEEGMIDKDTSADSTLSQLSQLDVAFTTRTQPYLESRPLPPIEVNITVTPTGASDPDYRDGETFEVVWNASGVDRCDVNVVPGTDDGFTGTTTITAVNATNALLDQEIKVACFTPAEPVENPPINVATQTISIKPKLPEVTLTAPSSGLVNRVTTVNWTSNYATTCRGVFDVNVNPLALSGGRNITYTSSGVKAVTVTCANGIGEEISDTANITLTWPSATVNLNVSSTSIYTGDNVTASWTSADAASCTNNFGATNGLSGSRTFNYSTAGTKTVTVTCTNGGGVSTTSTRTITVTDRIPVVSMSSPASVAANSNFNISWNSTYAARCDVNAIGGTSNGLSGNYTLNYSTTGTRNFSVTCYNASGVPRTATDSTNIYAVTPTVNVSAPSTINAGTSFNVSWTSSNAASCTNTFGATNGTSGNRNLSYPTTGIRTFSVTCTSSTGHTATSSASTNVVGITPTVSLSLSPSTITSGQSTTATWSSTNASSCSNNFGGSATTSGSYTNSFTTGTYTATVTCTSSTGHTASQSRTLTVNAPAIPLPTVSLTASPTGLTSGQSTTLTWISTNATSCSNNFSASGTSGSVSRSPSSNTTYTVTCTNAAGSRSASTAVTVVVPETPAFFDEISCGDVHCVHAKSGNAYFVGADNNGQTGLNSVCLGCSYTTSVYTTWRWLHYSPDYNPTVTKIWATAGSTFALHSNGQLWATGNNMSGQLGVTVTGCNPTSSNYFYTKCWVNTGQTGVTDVTSIGMTTYILKGGSIYSTRGGSRSSTNFHSIGISGVSKFFHTPYGPNRLLFQKTDGSLYEMNGSTESAVDTGLNAQVAYTTTNSLYAIVDGILWVKGANSSGQLGLGHTSSVSSWTNTGQPAASVAALSTRAFIIKGGRIWETTSSGGWRNTYVSANYLVGNGSSFVYGATTGGAMMAIGRGTEGQLGQGNKNNLSSFRGVASGTPSANTWK